MPHPDDKMTVQPLPFITVDDISGDFCVNPEARAVLETVKTRLVVVAVAGLYRTGKSFLLNLLAQHAATPDVAGSIRPSVRIIAQDNN